MSDCRLSTTCLARAQVTGQRIPPRSVPRIYSRRWMKTTMVSSRRMSSWRAASRTRSCPKCSRPKPVRDPVSTPPSQCTRLPAASSPHGSSLLRSPDVLRPNVYLYSPYSNFTWSPVGWKRSLGFLVVNKYNINIFKEYTPTNDGLLLTAVVSDSKFLYIILDKF